MAISGLYIDRKNYDIDLLKNSIILNHYYILDDIEYYYEFDENNLEQTYMCAIINIYNSKEDRANRINKINNLGYTILIDKDINLNNLWATLYTQIKQNLISDYTEYFKETLNVDILPEEYQNIIVFNDV
tara:strand:+ start:2346 stop:2735 length:390 start_codon:yes stop_codon:yes gene_type:complete